MVDTAATADFLAARRNGGPPDRANTRARSNLSYGPQQRGIYVYNQSGILGMRATHSAYNSALFAAYAGFVSNQLYAPTGKPGGGCIEVGTEYAPPARAPNVYAFDFCDGSAIGTFNRIGWIDDGGFSASYVRTINGTPSYTFQTLRNPDGRWTAYLYNYGRPSGGFDPLYTSGTGSFNAGMASGQRTQFWDMFEPKFTYGSTCIGTPLIAATDMAEYTASGWLGINSVGGGVTDPAGADPSCFATDDGSGVGAYYFFANTDYENWSLSSYASQPTPPPPPGSCDPSVDPTCCDAADPSSCCDPTLPTCCTDVLSCIPCEGLNCACPGYSQDNSPNCGPGAIIYSKRRQVMTNSASGRDGGKSRAGASTAPQPRPPNPIDHE